MRRSKGKSPPKAAEKLTARVQLTSSPRKKHVWQARKVAEPRMLVAPLIDSLRKKPARLAAKADAAEIVRPESPGPRAGAFFFAERKFAEATDCRSKIRRSRPPAGSLRTPPAAGRRLGDSHLTCSLRAAGRCIRGGDRHRRCPLGSPAASTCCHAARPQGRRPAYANRHGSIHRQRRRPACAAR